MVMVTWTGPRRNIKRMVRELCHTSAQFRLVAQHLSVIKWGLQPLSLLLLVRLLLDDEIFGYLDTWDRAEALESLR